MRAIGIDFGERRIGLALSDPEGRMAWPWKALERRNDRSAVRQISELAREEGVGRLVLGDPRSGGGAPGSASQRVRRFGLRLAAVSGLPVELIDETLTSVAAAERLREAGVRPAGRGAIDCVAAQILLEEALGGARTTLLSPGEGPEGEGEDVGDAE